MKKRNTEQSGKTKNGKRPDATDYGPAATTNFGIDHFWRSRDAGTVHRERRAPGVCHLPASLERGEEPVRFLDNERLKYKSHLGDSFRSITFI